ncbi:MAG: hypothetical protein ACXAEN_21125 [Candidatus Thorarchaeota archaeon]|jgi:hypothetical protein
MGKEDERLKEALKDYAKAILVYIADKAPPDYELQILLSQFIPKIHIFDEEDETLVPVNELPEAQRFKDEIRNHPVVGMHLNAAVGTEIGVARVELWAVLWKFMLHLIIRQRNLTFDEKAFESVFEYMMRFFNSERITIQFVAPLENFHFPEDEILLSNGWKLKRISEILREEWIRVADYNMLLPRTQLRTSHSLMKDFEMKKVIVGPGYERGEGPSILRQIVDEIEMTISAFRLLKKGRIIKRKIDRQKIGWHPWESSISPQSSNILETPGMIYYFSVEEVDIMNEMLDLLSHGKPDKALQVAIRRLNFAVERGYMIPEDRILDAMIAFDSLFGVDWELKYRISLRVAMLLGESSEEREILQEDLEYAYDLRSRIIHGNKEKRVKKVLKNWGYDLDQGAERLEELLRRVLREYMKILKKGKNREVMIKALDEMVLHDASISMLDVEKLPDNRLMDYLVSLGGTPQRIVEILRKRKILEEE